MSTTISLSPSRLSLSSSSFSPSLPHAPPMSSSLSFLRRLTPTLPHHQILSPRRREFSLLTVSAAAKTSTPTPKKPIWFPSPVHSVEPAAESLFHVSIDLTFAPKLIDAYRYPGQYLQLRLPTSPDAKPLFLAIANPPSFTAKHGEFEFLVKSIPGTTSELLCNLKRNMPVELSPVMGNGFDIDQITSAREFPTVLIFATGSGISPIRSLIETGFHARKRGDVKLYYGARNLKRMAYQDRFENWEASGVKVIPVLSQPDEGWTGETGYVQAAFSKAKNILKPQSTGAILCGQKQMTEEITSILTGEGVSSDKILKNF